MSEQALTEPRVAAGFWRRLGAFVLDVLLLGAVGLILGVFLAPQLVALGAWGRLLGFGMAWVYFGTLNSSIGGGQTVGKRAAGIQVVSQDGSALSVPKAFLRFVPLGLPWFLNNAALPQSALATPWLSLLSVLVFGLALALVYLFVFNRASRQSVHDLLVGSWVVKANAGERVDAAPLWPGHWVVCGLLLLIAAAAPVLMQGLAQLPPFPALEKARNAVNAEPWVGHAQVSKGKTVVAQAGEALRETTSVGVQAFMLDGQVQDPVRAKRLASLAISADPSFATVDVVQVVLVSGYDIGIASSWRSQTYARSPKEWLE